MLEPYSSSVLWIVTVSFIVGFVLAFGIGANTVPNSFATSVGAKVLTVRQACCLGTVFEMAGALLLAYKVSGTMRKGILQINQYEGAELELMLGMFAALIGSSVFLLIATYLKLPVSATHSIVGATIGFSLVCRGGEGLNWQVLGFIVLSWVLSPLMSGAMSVLMFLLVRHFILNAADPVARGFLCLPMSYGVTIFVNVFSVLLDGPPLLYFDRLPWWVTLLVSLCASAVTMLIVQVFVVPFLKSRIAGEQSKRSVVNADVLDGLDTDTACRDTTGVGTEVLTGPGGKNRQLEGPVTADTTGVGTEVLTGPGGKNRQLEGPVTADTTGVGTEVLTGPGGKNRQLEGPVTADTTGVGTEVLTGPGGKNRQLEGPVTADTTGVGTEVLTGPGGKNRQLEGPVTADELTASSKQAAPSCDVTELGHDNKAFSLSCDNVTSQSSPEHTDDHKNGTQVRQQAPPQLFAFLQILAATFASFARGGNDVSNAIGPLIAIWLIYTEGSVQQKSETPLYLLFYGGVGIAVGLWVWGQRVMATIGEDLTTITSSAGFTIELGAAFTMLLASKIGLPISTQHCKVGSIVFVGCANSTQQGVDWKVFRNIVGAWLVTVPVAGLFSAAAMAVLRHFAL